MDMTNFWLAIFMIIAGTIVILIPTAIFFYESDEDETLVPKSTKNIK